MRDKKVTIVIPVYNEAEIIEHVVRDFYENVIKKMACTQFVIAEDGSNDGTKDILKHLEKEIPMKLFTSEDRKGYTKAFSDALMHVNTELVFFSDSDGQHNPHDIFKMMNLIDRFDIISGYKSPRRDPAHRIILSKGYNLWIWLLFGFHLKDIDSGFKLIRKKVIDTVLEEPLCFDYCAMSEFILKAHLEGFSIAEVPVSHRPRKSGTTAIFTRGKLPGIMMCLVKSLLRLRYGRRKKEKK